MHTSRANLLPRGRHPDNDALAPPFVASFQGSPHHAYVTCAIKRVIASSVSHLHQLLLNALSPQLGWVHEIRRPKLLTPRFFAVVHIYRYDLGSSVLHCALDNAQTNAPRSKNRYIRTGLHVRGHNGCSVACGYAAS